MYQWQRLAAVTFTWASGHPAIYYRRAWTWNGSKLRRKETE